MSTRNVVLKPPLYLSTQQSVWNTLIDFLTAATHHILYLRNIYPPISFLATRAFNYPVRQNRHPDVCRWIQDAMEAVLDQIQKDRVKTVSLCIFETVQNEVLEKWLFDLKGLPSLKHHAWQVEFGTEAERFDLRNKIAVGDIEQNFRAFFSALDSTSGRIQPLPDGEGAPEYSFTIAVETRRELGGPLNHLSETERRWVMNECEVFTDDPYEELDEDDLPQELRRTRRKKSRANFRAIRRIDAGGLRLQAFVIEAEKKFKLPTTYQTLMERAAGLSYGVGTEKMPPEEEVFDPDEGYDLGEREIHRKPGGGAFTDYMRSRR